MAIHKGENPYIYGFHDSGGERLMLEDGTPKGWVLVTEALGKDPNDHRGSDYRTLSERGLGVIVRLNHDYGRNGTLPREEYYPDFAQRVANFVEASRGAHIWILGNETNLEREQPRKRNSGESEKITPRRYATCYQMCRQKIRSLSGHEDDLIVVGAIGPWNGETSYDADPQGQYPANKIAGGPSQYPYFGYFGDYLQYLRDTLIAIGPNECDGIAIHAYSHGYEAEKVFSQRKMNAPFQNYYYDFYTYRDQMNSIPQNMRHLPVYLTEANGDTQDGKAPHEPGATWPFGNNGWIKNAYEEINRWNETGSQQIRCLLLFRWMQDAYGWSIEGKSGVQQDFREAVARGYQWDPTVSTPVEPVDRPGYMTRYLNHNTPTEMPPATTIPVQLTIQNVGSYTWLQEDDKPFRLGFQWYTMEGKMVQIPPQFDFRTSLPFDVPPDGIVTLTAQLRTPDTSGSYHLRWDMLHEMVTWFTTQGDEGLLISPVTISPTAVVDRPKIVTDLQIQDISASLPGYPSSGYARRSVDQIQQIIIHHTATRPNVTVERIAQYQVNNKNLPGITYHFCVTDSGIVYQTQPLEVISLHAGNRFSNDSVGVCLIGNFTESPPPQTQLDAAAALLAQLTVQLDIPLNQIVGYSELVITGSPGATWPNWKPSLLATVSQILAGKEPTTPTEPGDVTPTQKPISHYLLLWYNNPNDWAEWDLRGAIDYIGAFAPTVGFSVEEAELAQHVTIVGGTGGVSLEVEERLKAAGCQVVRIAGPTETETRRQLEKLARSGQPH